MPGFLQTYLPYLLQRADQLMSARFHARLVEEGVQPSEWRVLAVLAESGPLTVGVLTRLTMLPQPTTSHAVSRLEQRGLVVRQLDDTDGRIRRVDLTASGRARAAELVDLAGREVQQVLEAAGASIPDQLGAELQRICRALDDLEPHHAPGQEERSEP